MKLKEELRRDRAMSGVSSTTYTYKRGVRLGGVFLVLLLAIAMTGVTTAYAVTYDLTGDGLGLSEGNHGTTLTVSPELTLSALTWGNATGYPSGYPGLIYVHQTEGTGVRWGTTGMSSKKISGWGIGRYESLVFDFPAGVDAQSVTMVFDEIHEHSGGDTVPVDLWVTRFSGSAFQISDVASYLHYTDSDTAYVDFSEIPDLNGAGCIERVIVRAIYKYHSYVSEISYQSCSDTDGDGYPADDDCDDSDPDVNPGATEICNGVDDNCDGQIDEGCYPYYRDADGDGWGDPNDFIITNTGPPMPLSTLALLNHAMGWTTTATGRLMRAVHSTIGTLTGITMVIQMIPPPCRNPAMSLTQVIATTPMPM
jgi:hypothetical protein